jgi:hypothetical protein
VVLVTATPDDQVTAILAAVNAQLPALPADRRAYDADDVPTDLPMAYVAVSVSRRYIDGFRGGGGHGMRGGRVVLRYVARSVSDARELQRRARLALEDVTLAATGGLVGPFRFESEESIGSDEGWYSGADAFTYATPA